jgi:hypothetical protein
VPPIAAVARDACARPTRARSPCEAGTAGRVNARGLDELARTAESATFGLIDVSNDDGADLHDPDEWAHIAVISVV